MLMEKLEKQKQIHPSGLNIIQNGDGSFAFEWDPKDERWSWMNDLTDQEIRSMIEKIVDETDGLQ